MILSFAISISILRFLKLKRLLCPKTGMALPDEYVARPCRGGMRNYKMNEVRNPSKEVGNH